MHKKNICCVLILNSRSTAKVKCKSMDVSESETSIDMTKRGIFIYFIRKYIKTQSKLSSKPLVSIMGSIGI